MDITIQYIILSVIFASIIIYFALSIRKSYKNRNNRNTACSGCSLKDSCSPDSKKNTKKCAEDIANSKK